MLVWFAFCVLRHALQLFFDKYRGSSKKTHTIVIDAGHGGTDIKKGHYIFLKKYIKKAYLVICFLITLFFYSSLLIFGLKIQFSQSNIFIHSM